jgi:TPR repeat protein
MPTTPTDKFKALLAQAEAGDAEAQFITGFFYGNGEVIKKDLNQAFNWCQQSAEQGFAPAQYRVGMCYMDGEGTRGYTVTLC